MFMCLCSSRIKRIGKNLENVCLTFFGLKKKDKKFDFAKFLYYLFDLLKSFTLLMHIMRNIFQTNNVIDK
jgi:hypothetical protein